MRELDVAAGIAEHFEGLRLSPYLCPAGVPTIGYGTTHYENGKAVTLTDPAISSDRAEELLQWEMSRSLLAAARLCPVLLTNPDAWGAISDFVYNLGPGRLQCSTLRRRINQGNWKEAARELQKWVFGGGKKLPGLILRRGTEARFLP